MIRPHVIGSKAVPSRQLFPKYIPDLPGFGQGPVARLDRLEDDAEKGRAAIEGQKPARMNIRVVDETELIFQYVLIGVAARHFLHKFRRDDEPVHVDQYLRVENRRHEIVMMTKATNDLANNPRHALILRGVNHMSVALGRRRFFQWMAGGLSKNPR